eukprot:GEMP01024171.1.p1 GENE.GEMP01024171.1~~GEMP01024171.1.p1  ORF type:complete len:379 (+),score=109.38 GEMP01024171.1:63-1139(+)
MPPKRKVAQETSSKSKKQKVVDPLKEKVDLIVDAIETHHDDFNIKQLLLESAKTAFEDPKDKRHRFHETFITMIESSLQTYIADFDSKMGEARSKVNNADSVKAQNVENRDHVSEALDQKKEVITQKGEELKAKEEQVKVATKELKMKKGDKSKACAPLIQLETQLEECESKKDIFIKMRDDIASMSAAQRKTALKQLTPYFEKINLDGSLIMAAPLALQKETRAGFDAVTVSEVGNQFTTFSADLKRQIDEEKVKNVTIIVAVEEAEKVLDAAKEASKTATEELEVLENEKTELDKKKKAAEKEIKDHDKNVKIYASELQENTETYESLTKVLGAMIELRDRLSEKEEVAEEIPECL